MTSRSNHFYGYTLNSATLTDGSPYGHSVSYLWGKCNDKKLIDLFMTRKGTPCGQYSDQPGFIDRNHELQLYPHYENAMIGTTFHAVLKRDPHQHLKINRHQLHVAMMLSHKKWHTCH